MLSTDREPNSRNNHIDQKRGGETQMINFEEELEKFQPSVDVEQVEEVVNKNTLTDVTDIVKELITDTKGNNR